MPVSGWSMSPVKVGTGCNAVSRQPPSQRAWRKVRRRRTRPEWANDDLMGDLALVVEGERDRPGLERVRSTIGVVGGDNRHDSPLTAGARRTERERAHEPAAPQVSLWRWQEGLPNSPAEPGDHRGGGHHCGP